MKHVIPVRTLVIDDDEPLCRRLAGWLEAEDQAVETFTDPRAGVERAEQERFDLALVDLRMPDVDGVTVLARLREVTPDTRLVALSAFPEPDQVRRAVRAGARALLEKPIQQPELLRVAREQLAEIGVPVREEAEFNHRLGARLRLLRTRAERPQNEVAEEAGITPAQLSQIELGKTATSTWTLARICGVLRVPLDSLFDEM